MSRKDEIAGELIANHFAIEPHLEAVYRIVTDNEASATEPIKLLEINAATVSTGDVTAFEFAPTGEVPFPTIIAEITPADFQSVETNKLQLPKGWRLETAQRFTRQDHAA